MEIRENFQEIGFWNFDLYIYLNVYFFHSPEPETALNQALGETFEAVYGQVCERTEEAKFRPIAHKLVDATSLSLHPFRSNSQVLGAGISLNRVHFAPIDTQFESSRLTESALLCRATKHPFFLPFFVCVPENTIPPQFLSNFLRSFPKILPHFFQFIFFVACNFIELVHEYNTLVEKSARIPSLSLQGAVSRPVFVHLFNTFQFRREL